MAQKLPPLVVILGATGSGKTKLSLELAKKFRGEIIGADSMQVYKGLDIITAKATKEEQSVAPHHLIDFLEPHETCTVLEYRNRALRIIDDLLKRNKLPIVVGGTNYYIESLLWKILVEEPGRGGENPTPGVLPDNEHELPSEELHKKLKRLDPTMARRLHPNNKRKILRSLEVLYQKGKKHSEILEEQHADGGNQTGGRLRMKNSVILWLQSNQGTLDRRLDERVDKMMDQGLVNELLEFHEKYVATSNSAPDYTKGVFQSIGFKEFSSFLTLEKDARNSEKGSKLLEEGVARLKIATRRYARKQCRWINNRFLGRRDREVPPVYGLDVTDLSSWNRSVHDRAIGILDSYVEGVPCPQARLPFLPVERTANSQDDTFLCEVCERVFVGSHQWTIHRTSGRHRREAERKRCRGPPANGICSDDGDGAGAGAGAVQI